METIQVFPSKTKKKEKCKRKEKRKVKRKVQMESWWGRSGTGRLTTPGGAGLKK